MGKKYNFVILYTDNQQVMFKLFFPFFPVLSKCLNVKYLIISKLTLLQKLDKMRLRSPKKSNFSKTLKRMIINELIWCALDKSGKNETFF